MCVIYQSPSQNHQFFFDNIDKALDIYCSNEKIVLAVDFNTQEGERLPDTLLYQHELHSNTKNPICYKNPSNPGDIDLILTNCPKKFFKTDTIFTDLSDFHKSVLSVCKTTFATPKPKVAVCRNYRKFYRNNFYRDFHNQSSSEQPKDYACFEKVLLSILEEHAPLKRKLLCSNHVTYITKAPKKAIMRRSYLEKLHFKKRTPSSLKKYKEQKNYCSKLYEKGVQSIF